MARSSTARLISLDEHRPHNTKKARKPNSKLWQGHDPFFIHKDQIKKGVKLLYFGRRDHGELWEVVRLLTFVKNGRRLEPVTAAAIEHPWDAVVLRRISDGRSRQLRFYSVSIPAYWRFPE